MVHTKTVTRYEHAVALASSHEAIRGLGAILQRRQDSFARKWLDSSLRIADQLGMWVVEGLAAWVDRECRDDFPDGLEVIES